MRRLRYTVDDLMEAMREQEIFDISEIHSAIVETNGKIHFMQKKDFQSASKEDIGLKESTGDPQSVLIRDGVEDEEQLTLLGLGKGWLHSCLRSENLSVKDVFLMTADKNGCVKLSVPRYSAASYELVDAPAKHADKGNAD